MNTSSHVFSVAQVPDCLRPTRPMQASTLAIFATRALRAIAVPHIPAGARSKLPITQISDIGSRPSRDDDYGLQERLS